MKKETPDQSSCLSSHWGSSGTARLDKNQFVFPALRGRGPFASHAQMQGELIDLMRADLPALKPFVLHDLRRTMRTLASRIGIDREVAERMIGHTIGSQLEAVYNRDEFFQQMTSAFQRMADHIEQIVSPEPSANVVRMGRRSR